MNRTIYSAAFLVVLLESLALADGKSSQQDVKASSATFMITGMHGPGCASTIEKSLANTPGLQSIKVAFDTKLAKVQFDEGALPASRIAQLIAATPHMMGPSMHYGGMLLLKVPDLKDNASVSKAKDTLEKVKGVKQVTAIPEKLWLEVQFAADAKTTSQQLIEALAAAGFKAEIF